MARRVVGALVVAAATMIAPASGGRAVVALDALDASNEVSGLFAFSYWWYGTIRQPPMKKVSPPSLPRRAPPIAGASESAERSRRAERAGRRSAYSTARPRPNRRRTADPRSRAPASRRARARRAAGVFDVL